MISIFFVSSSFPIEQLIPAQRKVTQYKPPEPVAPEEMNSDSDDSVLSFHGGVGTCFAKLPYRRPFIPPEKTPLPKSIPNTPKVQKTTTTPDKTNMTDSNIITKKVFYPKLNQVTEKEKQQKQCSSESIAAEELDIADFQDCDLDVQ